MERCKAITQKKKKKSKCTTQFIIVEMIEYNIGTIKAMSMTSNVVKFIESLSNIA